MSRKGNRIIQIPQNTEVVINKTNVFIKGKLGQLTVNYPSVINVVNENNTIKVSRINEIKQSKMHHGTVNANIFNAIVGVNEGYKKVLKIVGVGYKAAIANNQVVLTIGFTHLVKLDIPVGIKAECPSPTEIVITGYDKIVVGEFAANIRIVRKPEPYKGKGIMYDNEKIIRKVGKTAEGAKK